jgi:hypothetical protein
LFDFTLQSGLNRDRSSDELDDISIGAHPRSAILVAGSGNATDRMTHADRDVAVSDQTTQRFHQRL